MKKVRNFAILMLSVLLVATGCGKNSNMSAEDRLEKALNNLNKLDSFTVEMKVEAEAEVEGEEAVIDLDLTVEAETNKKDEVNMYLAADLTAEAAGEEVAFDFETYILANEDEAGIYAYSEEFLDDWYFLELDADDMDLDFEFNDDEEVDMDSFKKIKEVKSDDKKLTKLEVKVDAEELSSDELEVEEDVKMYFYIDKDNNLVKIEVDLTDMMESQEEVEFSKFDMVMEFSKLNDTKVKVDEDIEEDAIELTEEDLEELVYSLMGGFTVEDEDYDYDYDYDYEDLTDEDWTAEEIYDDIILSAGMQCDNKAFVVDFSNYNDELRWVEDTYDMSRVTSGAITYTEDCDFEVTTPIVIDGLTCEEVDYETICK